MQTIDTEVKKQLILDNETKTSRQLALHVIEKPTPRVWMIFIPVFFVFYFWKLKEYESGLKSFTENHLIPRRRVLNAVFEAEENGRPVDMESLVNLVDGKDEKTRVLCREWLTMLVAHFRLLLSVHGDTYPALIRSGYRSKSNYLLFCRQLGKAEAAFNTALLPTIREDNTILHQVTQAITEGTSNLRKKEAEEIFS